MRFFSRKPGQSIVEFVIVLPIILLICVAMISIGMFIYCKLLVVTASTQASKHGAYLYQTRPDADYEIRIEIRQRALYYIDKGVPISDGSYVSVNVELSDAVFNVNGINETVGRYCIVTVTYPFTFIFPLSDTLFGSDPIPITYKSKSMFLIRE